MNSLSKPKSIYLLNMLENAEDTAAVSVELTASPGKQDVYSGEVAKAAGSSRPGQTGCMP